MVESKTVIANGDILTLKFSGDEESFILLKELKDMNSFRVERAGCMATVHLQTSQGEMQVQIKLFDTTSVTDAELYSAIQNLEQEDWGKTLHNMAVNYTWRVRWLKNLKNFLNGF